MCGLLALAVHSGQARDGSGERDVLAHRGPDHAGSWRAPSGRAWLGHRRLSLVDLSPAGNQPMVARSGDIALVANNEIYNAPTLRKQLEGHGFEFTSHSDTEVILHGYRAWGIKVVERLEGMFAFVLWDDANQLLVASRDRVGIKPLYFTMTADGIAFASEARALLRLSASAPEVDPEALAYVMTLGYVPSPLSIWRGIEKVEPATLTTWKPGGDVRRFRYWSPPSTVEEADDGSSFETIFHSVLEDHLLADVPLSVLMSGGIDSTAVALGLCRLGRKDIEAYTVDFGGDDEEAEIASQTCSNLSLKQHLVPLKTTDVPSLLEQAARDFDEPQGYSALLTMHHISAAVSTRHKAVLAGDGGDEVFGGYTWYATAEQEAAAERPRQQPWYRSIADGISFPVRFARRPKRVRTWETFASTSPLHAHASRVFPRFLPEEASLLLAPTGLVFDDEKMLAPLEKHYVPTLPRRRALQRVDLLTFCSDSILSKVDRASMAHSLEVRVPLLDRRIIEYGLRLPVSAAERSRTKPTLRSYLGNDVPERVHAHAKRGFSLASREGIDWQGALEDIAASCLMKAGVLNPDFVKFLAPNHPYHHGRVWTLMALSRWSNYHLRDGDEQARDDTVVKSSTR